MHPYLVRLGVHPAVQAYFAPYYTSDTFGDLSFDYADAREIYGLAWHRVPSAEDLWMAGSEDFSMIRRVFICSSAMEAIAWLHYHHSMLGNLDQLCFLATGSSLSDSKLQLLRDGVAGKQCALLYSNDLLGKICDLKVCAALCSQPVTISACEDRVGVAFRAVTYELNADQFSLNKFEKLAAFRFNVQTLKPKGALTWLDRLTASAFNNI
jgi:hypothetical protein